MHVENLLEENVSLCQVRLLSFSIIKCLKRLSALWTHPGYCNVFFFDRITLPLYLLIVIITKRVTNCTLYTGDYTEHYAVKPWCLKPCNFFWSVDIVRPKSNNLGSWTIQLCCCMRKYIIELVDIQGQDIELSYWIFFFKSLVYLWYKHIFEKISIHNNFSGGGVWQDAYFAYSGGVPECGKAYIILERYLY